ncbi:hypothetical protein FA15DRAFT_462320 [Coprinopsis marcescibilis]|uniref:Uncharacterized protein n=1 Tax=Coprinopsis marcescibilis TaxID=230819 RepID=A0A5C3KT97_COPMA|nr:hypothetical protein FA15DRAFT_462320 [Coprinopsis marcescibilis]
MAAYLVIGGQNRGVYSSLDEIPFNIPPQAPLPIIIECWGEANVSQLDAISSAVEEAGAKLVSGTTWTAKDHREAVTAIIQKEESLSATLAETPWSQHSKFYALLNSPKQRNFIALEYKSVLPFLMDTRKGEYRILTFPTFIRAVVWTLAQGNTNLNNWGPDFSEWVGHARGPATNGPGGPLRPIPNDENSDEQGDFRRTVKATINIHSTHFRIYDITVPALQMKFEVKKGSGSPYDGTLYYNRVEDIKPNSSELATTGSLDGCLAVRFRNGDVLFISM